MVGDRRIFFLWSTAGRAEVTEMDDTAVVGERRIYPRAPGKIKELGILPSVVEDLFVRRLLQERIATVSHLSEALGIRMSIGQELGENLRTRQLVEYHGLEGRDYRIGLTEGGNRFAKERAQQSTYASYTPVCLADYTNMVWKQKAEMRINRESIREAFGDLVVADELLDQLGPAFMNDGAIFLYGPPGTGKTSLAERMIRIHKDKVLVPRALEIDGQIIQVFDPSVHTPVDEQPEALDPRWVLCDRPIVIVGGEMTMGMLELDYDPNSGTYTAPIQLQANNGILVVDDFGRQQMTPGELLNRWIVPLSRSVDFLKLVSGSKFTVPFELKLVASTNLDPQELGDDAFLRRLKNKVFIGPISDNAFNWILVRAAKAMKIEVSAEAAEHLREVAIANIKELRPYVAIDFLEMMKGIAQYEGRPRELNRYMIDRVASVYFFTDETDKPPALHALNGPGGSQPVPAHAPMTYEQNIPGGYVAPIPSGAPATARASRG